MTRPHLLFITGKLAAPALHRVLTGLAPAAGFDYQVAELPITVAALASTGWIGRHLRVPEGIDRVILPGLCAGDVAELHASVPVERGPKDLLDLPDYFGAAKPAPTAGASHDISLLAEINHVPRLSRNELLQQADAYRATGADVIDLGCDPGTTWGGVGDAVRALRDRGLRVSIDSFEPTEVEAAVAAGAELVLSVNSSNCARARSWGCEVVVIPDVPATLAGFDETIGKLQDWGVPFRVDAVLEPIGFGFAASLHRYLSVRERYPGIEMMMGIGNLTELTGVDSAGINVLLLGFCQELGIRSVLSTEVVNWCRTAIHELNLARRVVYRACRERILPKHLDPDLVMLRDPKLRERGAAALEELAHGVADRNFRLFAERGLLHVLNGHLFLQGTDPFELFAQMEAAEAIDPAHAFYLGYEMAKAVTALTLGKNYVQDEALRWGFLTVPERPHQGTMRGDPT
jgi:dihydropteroate synthase-like protein